MWLVALLVVADSSHAFPLVLPRAESVQVAVAGAEAGAPVVLIPGLFGAAFAYRKVIPRLTEAGYRAIVIEPLGVGSSGRPERADRSEEHTSELQSRLHLVCRLLLEKKKKKI